MKNIANISDKFQQDYKSIFTAMPILVRPLLAVGPAVAICTEYMVAILLQKNPNEKHYQYLT